MSISNINTVKKAILKYLDNITIFDCKDRFFLIKILIFDETKNKNCTNGVLIDSNIDYKTVPERQLICRNLIKLIKNHTITKTLKLYSSTQLKNLKKEFEEYPI